MANGLLRFARNDGVSADDKSASPLIDADFDEVFTAENLTADGAPLLLGVSGGSDSTALMHAAAAWCRRSAGPALFVATVDHGLRSGSRTEADEVARQAAELRLPHAILAWTNRPATVSQQAAREARYGLLAAHALAVGARRIATAHTFDDQVETILMRLADGSGLSGLTGMAQATQRGPIAHIRPFLHLRKAALVATCRARGWSFAEDPTNRDPRFARPRWRGLAALLASEGLTPERIFRLGGRMRRAEIALEAMAERVALDVIRDAQPSPGGGGSTAKPAGWGDTALVTHAHVARTDSEFHPTPDLRSDSPPPGEGEARNAVTLDFAALTREPDEIVLRVLIRALRLADAGSAHLRLERVESALAALTAARLTGSAVRRTLAGCVLSLDRAGILTIAPEPSRRRGR